jgi:putative transposase
MPNYRRDRQPGGTWFFTLVTGGREPWLTESRAIDALRDSFANVRAARPFRTWACVVLPDHLHFIWQLPEGDSDFSFRIARLKRLVTLALPRARRIVATRESGRWQPRFWEHRIRDEHDLQRHVDYIHFNPVKHGLVAVPGAWPHSSFHRFVRAGIVASDWAASPPGLRTTGE